MNFLITAGSPISKIPGLGVEVRVTDTGCVDGHEVASLLIEAGHDVTVITTTPGSLPDKGVTILEYSDLDSLQHQLSYLAGNEEFDAIAHLANIPVWENARTYTSHSEMGAFGSGDELHEVKNLKRWPEHDPWVRLTAIDNSEMNPIVDLMHCLSTSSEAMLICRDNVYIENPDQTPHDHISERINDMKSDGVDVTLFDPHLFDNRTRLPAGWMLGKNGAAEMDSDRLKLAIYDAMLMGREKLAVVEEIKADDDVTAEIELSGNADS